MANADISMGHRVEKEVTHHSSDKSRHGPTRQRVGQEHADRDMNGGEHPVTVQALV